MVKIDIFYQDLNELVKQAIWQAVRDELLARREVEYRQEDETEEEFQQRLEEEVDHYINCHNFANGFYL